MIGFVLFLFPSLLPVDAALVTLLGFTGILAGAVTLVWRLRPGDDDDHDPTTARSSESLSLTRTSTFPPSYRRPHPGAP